MLVSHRQEQLETSPGWSLLIYNCATAKAGGDRGILCKVCRIACVEISMDQPPQQLYQTLGHNPHCHFGIQDMCQILSQIVTSITIWDDSQKLVVLRNNAGQHFHLKLYRTKYEINPEMIKQICFLFPPFQISCKGRKVTI